MIYLVKWNSNDYRVLFNNAVHPLIVRDMLGFRVMVFNATFNNISVISWRSVLLVEETGVPEENHQPAVSHCQTLSHNVASSTPRLQCLYGLNTVK
jgi:hypothetical protein